MKPLGRKHTTVEVPSEALKQSRAVEKRRARAEMEQTEPEVAPAELRLAEVDAGLRHEVAWDWKHEEGLIDAE